MRVLVLGGTAFVGHAVVSAALAHGWQVTTFNRGRTGEDVPGVQAVRGDRNSKDDVAALVDDGPWDAAIDTSGYVPRDVLAVARTLEPVTGHYVFMSTVSVYAGWPSEPLSEESQILPCPPDAGPDFGENIEDGPTQYGYQKSGSESAVKAAFGNDRVTVLRPGVVLGPREYVGRLPWWLRRVAAGGRVVAPATPERSIQPVDVRDLASFVIHCIERDAAGSFNVTAPVGRETFGGFLQSCADVTNSTAKFVWVPDETLLTLGVRQWSEMPLWRTFRGVWQVESTRAHAIGLRSRRLAETVQDTWAWLIAADAQSDHDRANEVGITPQREREILAAVS